LACARTSQTRQSANKKRGRGGCRRNVERVIYDRSERYEALRPKKPTPRFGARSHDMNAFIDPFLTDREARGLPPETFRSYVSDLGVFAQWLRDERLPHDPAAWDVHLIRSYVVYLQRKPNKNRAGRISAMTVRSCTSRLLAFLRWLHEESYAPIDLAAKLKKPQAVQRVIQPLNSEDVLAMLDAAAEDTRNGLRNHALLCMFLDSGLRASEVCGLRPSDVLWEQQLVKVLGKAGRERIVPFSSETGNGLRRYLAADGSARWSGESATARRTVPRRGQTGILARRARHPPDITDTTHLPMVRAVPACHQLPVALRAESSCRAASELWQSRNDVQSCAINGLDSLQQRVLKPTKTRKKLAKNSGILRGGAAPSGVPPSESTCQLFPSIRTQRQQSALAETRPSGVTRSREPHRCVRGGSAKTVIVRGRSMPIWGRPPLEMIAVATADS
jgi:site-specific recombinase XerD